MIEAIPVTGVFTVNAYLYADDVTGHGYLIDPGAEGERLIALLEERQITLDGILLTHGHYDHIGAVARIRRYRYVPVFLHEQGRRYATDTEWNLSAPCGDPTVLEDITYIAEGRRFSLPGTMGGLVTIHIPGHTPDSVMYYDEQAGVAFVGDALFKNSPGLTRFPGGNAAQLKASVCRKVLTLPASTVLLSGHSEPTTVGDERYRPWYR